MNNMFVVSTCRNPVVELAAALGRNAGVCAFHKLQQSLLNAFAAHVTGDRWIFCLTADLVDFVDIDNAALRLFDV